jgi:hypothetical protein
MAEMSSEKSSKAKADHSNRDHAKDDHANFGDELRLLAEALLEKVEPALRRAAVGANQEEWSSCDWCPVCAVSALVRGEHHDLLGTLADHGTAVVIVLREALAGIPVEPKLPPEFADAANGAAGDSEGKQRAAAAASTPDPNKLVNIPVTIKPANATADRSSGHNSSSWAPVV